MNNKKLTVTIGIPAYNEEKNITHLLSSLLAQEETFYKIESIFVVSDGSTDSTIGEVKKFADKRIKVMDNSVRKGQAYSQNKIFSQSNSNVVVLLEADTTPKDNKYLHHLLSPILSDPSVGLVGGNSVALSPKKLFGKMIYYKVKAYKKTVNEYEEFKYWLFSGRGGKAFTKSVYKKLIWPRSIPEDAYAMVWCLRYGIKIVFEKNAVCNYRIPESLEDSMREYRKIKSGRTALEKYFPVKFLDLCYNRPTSFMIRSFVRYFISYPAYCLLYFLFKLRLKFNSSSPEFTDLWPMTSSTKNLYKYE